MSFHISKSKLVAAWKTCNKHAWLDAYMPDQKAPVDEFAQSLFDNGHKVGELAKAHYCVDVDVTVNHADGTPNRATMLRETQKHLKLGTKVIAEAAFEFNGCYCAVDILVRNADGTYNMYEVKSAKAEKPKKKDPQPIQDKYLKDAAYQRYVLENCGVKLNRVYLVLLSREYVRGKTLELDKYFAELDVTDKTAAMQSQVADKIAQLRSTLADTNEPLFALCDGCQECDYFAYCGRHIPKPSPFDVQGMNFSAKCQFYRDGVSFFDIPKKHLTLSKFAKRQIEYYNRPDDAYIDKAAVKAFLDQLRFPLYSLDFETYEAKIPEFEGVETGEAIPFQYSLHIMQRPDGDYTEGSPDLKEHHYLDISGRDTRRAIAESLVLNIPYGACVVAWHESTERNIIKRLADRFPDLAKHLLSFTYQDPSKLFKDGLYYSASMGNRYSIKSVAPALYPDDPGMDYHNLEGDIKNGGQAMAAINMASKMSPDEIDKLRQDLEQYCALDTMAVVKILKKLYEVVR